MRKVIIYRHQLFKPSEGFIVQQTKYLSEYRPIFAGRNIYGRSYETETRLIQPVNPLHLIRHALFRNNNKLYQTLSQDKPDLMHAHFGVEGVYALPLAKKLNIPLITTFHGFDATCSQKALLLSKKISWLNYLIHRQQLAQNGNLFICVSDFIRERLLRLGFPENKLITHYIGVDTDTIKPAQQAPSKKIILHVARLVEKKGTEYLLKAFALLKKKKIEAELVIIGDGPLASTLTALATKLGIQKNVQFLGVQPASEVITWMQKATLFCLPSIEARSGDTEGLGMVFLEAAACQVPVVATQHGGIPEAVHDGNTGLLVPEKNSDALAERLAYLLENDSVRKKMGIAARSLVETKFNLMKQTHKLETIYDALMLNKIKQL